MKFNITIAFLLNLFITTQAQEYYPYFSHFNIQNGLVNNIVTDVVQDQKGYVWIGTLGGLQRFDGKNFLTFNNSNSSLPSNTILKLFADREGILWIITSKGIYQHSEINGFAPVHINVQASSSFYGSNFFQDSHGTIWLGLQDAAFYYDKRHNYFLPYSKKWPSLKHAVTFLQQERQADRFWLTTQSELIQYDPHNGKSAPYNLDSVFYSHVKKRELIVKIKTFYLDNVNTIWITFSTHASRNYTFRYDIQKQEWTHVKDAAYQSVKEILTTVEGSTWAVANSILRLNSDHWEVFKISGKPSINNIPAELFYCVFEDRDGTLWIGTDNGIYIFSSQQYKFSNIRLSLNLLNPLARRPSYSDRVNMIHIQDSLIVIGTEASGKGVAVYNLKFDHANRFGDLINSKDPLYKRVSAMHKGKSGFIWVGCHRGRLMKIDQNNFNVDYIIVPQLENANVTSLMEDSLKNLWMGSSSGILIKRLQSESKFEKVIDLQNLDGYKKSPIIFISGTGRNTLWISTNHQIIKVNIQRNEAEIFNLDHDTSIWDIKNWDEETWLVGTDQGLYFFDKPSGQFRAVMTEEGAFNYYVTGVITDHLHNIWIATRGNGLFRISSSLKEIRNFGTHEGVIHSNFIPASNLRLPDNKILLVTTQGGLVFHPSELPSSLFNPRVQIVSFRINDVALPDSVINNTARQALRLNWQQNTVSIDFSSMSFIYNDKTSFSYQLQGQDASWLTARGNETIKYSNLRPGDYTFKVRCKPLAGQGISDEASISFSIIPPWWDRLSFKLFVVVLFVVFVLSIFMIRVKRIMMVQDVKNRISRDLHDHIGSSLSSISLMLKSAMHLFNSDAQQSQMLLNKIADTARLTQENLYDIVWSIHAENNTFSHITIRMQEFLSSVFEGQNVKAEFLVPERIEKLNLRLEKRYNLYLIFKEIVNNAAKYAQANHIKIELLQNKSNIMLKYMDNGIGFDMDSNQWGNGIKNMYARAKLLRGKIKISSERNRGTKIELDFPI